MDKKSPAVQGNLYALTMLGHMHIIGDAVPKYHTIGYAYITVASEREHKPAIKYKELILKKYKPSEEFLRKSRIIASSISEINSSSESRNGFDG